MLATLRATGALALHGGAFASPNWLYWLDYATYPLLVMWLAMIDCRSFGWVAAAFAGLVLFTFVEYWAHRLVLHQIFYHQGHQRHHTHPAEYVVFPIWYLPSIFAAFFVVLPLSVFTGFIVGYIWFHSWHHVLHHVDLSRWPRAVQRYAIWHFEHHRIDGCNFGITVPVWDFVFRSYRRSPGRGSAPDGAPQSRNLK
jgi:sterol desaturase/sphingolipid hydroxylase (fatty acid hydroxylase superfamily)